MPDDGDGVPRSPSSWASPGCFWLPSSLALSGRAEGNLRGVLGGVQVLEPTGANTPRSPDGGSLRRTDVPVGLASSGGGRRFGVGGGEHRKLLRAGLDRRRSRHSERLSGDAGLGSERAGYRQLSVVLNETVFEGRRRLAPTGRHRGLADDPSGEHSTGAGCVNSTPTGSDPPARGLYTRPWS